MIVGSLAPLVASWRGGFATLSAAGFEAEEGIADGYNSSAMMWDSSSSDLGGLDALHDALTPEVFRCLMRWDHWLEMVVPDARVLQVCMGVWVTGQNIVWVSDEHVAESPKLGGVIAAPHLQDDLPSVSGRPLSSGPAFSYYYYCRTISRISSSTTARTACPTARRPAPQLCASRARRSRMRSLMCSGSRGTGAE